MEIEQIKVKPCCALCNNLYDKEECPLCDVYVAAGSYGEESFDTTAKYQVYCPSFVLDERLMC